MKKILFLIFTPNNSGGEIVIKNLIQANNQITASALIGCNYENQISKNDIRTKYIQKLNRNSHNIISYSLKALYLTLGLTVTILRLQRKYSFDIIYANTLTMASYGILTRIVFFIIYPRVKFIWHDHNINHLTSRSDLFAEKICNLLYSKTIVVSNVVYNKSTQTNNKKILLYNGVNTALFKERESIRKLMRSKFSIKNKLVIGIFGVISEDKGHIKLIKAIGGISNHNNLINLVIIGKFASKEIEQKIYSTIKDLEMTNVILLRFVNNISDYYSLIDICINNTSIRLSEPFGLTIIEGMASSKIVIASKTGGPTEIISDGVDGFLFEPDSISELKSKIEYVIKNFNKLGYIRKNARKKIMQKFTIEQMVTSFNKIININ